ncbi:MAG: hypothetical protein KME06_07820 [Kastovskya adunca ATA6-11-RM4]|jgi:hypothetical protein|nr:hypothetical protein [Kastovskya adunca ATA6-11-RM4]
MTSLNTETYLLLENLIFFVLATAFLAIVGWAWRQAKPYTLPEHLPGWFRIWFGTVQFIGVVPPLVAIVWGAWQGYTSVLTVFIPYFIMLALQILSESLTLRRFRSVVWVMVPYLYLPYRFWQLYEGWTILSPGNELMWVRYLLVVEIVLWIGNYALDLAQLPRLLRWEVQER